MTEAARALLAALDDAELEQTLFALDAQERSHWSNVPYQAHHRPGLKIGGLDRERMLLVHDLLRASLSSQGYQKVAGIIRLDDINRAQQVARLQPDATAYAKAQAESFGSDNYFVLFFGDPRSDARWGWLDARSSPRRQLHGRRRQDGIPTDVRRRDAARGRGGRRDGLVGVGPRSDKRR